MKLLQSTLTSLLLHIPCEAALALTVSKVVLKHTQYLNYAVDTIKIAYLDMLIDTPQRVGREGAGWLANIITNCRENRPFAGKHKPTAGQTMPTIALEQKAIGIRIQHCESDG